MHAGHLNIIISVHIFWIENFILPVDKELSQERRKMYATG